MPTVKAPEETRKRILDAAFLEFFRNGFQGGGLNDIVTAAGITKGALFHHFGGKYQLGYAVVDEVIGPMLLRRWLGSLDGAADPIEALKGVFRACAREDTAKELWMLGCPLNNLAQEMSPLDEGFHQRIDGLYDTWREHFAAALAEGLREGKVRQDVQPHRVAALLVAAQMGIWGTAKSSQRKEVMLEAIEAVCDYLDTLKP
jgi:AcrR family transcriptional regulator